MAEHDGLYTFTLKNHHSPENGYDREWQEYDSLNQWFVDDTTTTSSSSNSSRKRRLRQRTRDLVGGVDSHLPGIQYIDMFVGKPAQRLTFAISTVSDHTIFPCTSDCPGHVCNGAKQVQFESSESSTFERMSCDQCMVSLDDELSTSSNWACKNNLCTVEGFLSSTNDLWTGYHGRDYVHAGDTSKVAPRPIVGTDRTVTEGFKFIFACQLSVSGMMDVISKNANGILGLSTAETSFVHQMSKAGRLNGSFFSICFHRKNELTYVEKSAGTLVLGGYNAKHHTTEMIYVANTMEGNKHYTVKINNIYLRKGGGDSVKPRFPDQKIVKIDYDQDAMKDTYAFLDSTSPYTHLFEVVSEPFKTAWKQMTGIDFRYNPMDISDVEMLGFPTILLQLRTSYSKNTYVNPDETPGMAGYLDRENPFDALLAIPPQHYMEFVPGDGGGYRIRLSVNKPNYSVIGSNILQGRHLNFDLISPRIGIAETTMCEEPRTPFPTPQPTYPLPTKNPTRYRDSAAYQQMRLPSSSPSIEPSSRSQRTFQVSRGDLAQMFSRNSFSYEQFYYIGMGVLGLAFVLIASLSFLAKQQTTQEEKKNVETQDRRSSLRKGTILSRKNVSYQKIKRMPSYLQNKHKSNKRDKRKS